MGSFESFWPTGVLDLHPGGCRLDTSILYGSPTKSQAEVNREKCARKKENGMKLTHKYTLMCDDIRQEMSGKLILIGVYMDKVAVPHTPFSYPSLTFFQVFECDGPANLQFRIRIEHLENGQLIAEGMGMMSVQKAGLGIAPVKLSPIPFPAPGSYHLITSIENQEPIIFPFDVFVAPAPRQFTPQPNFPR